jgi:hypothetical protein
MRFFGMKATKAFAIGVVLSGLVVGCNEASQVAKIAAPEAEVVGVSAGKSTQSAQLTAEERETKKREFFAKPEIKEMSAGLEEIAEAVAVAVEDKELRDRIYAKCMEKFDGETNVLWQQLEGDNNLRSKGGWNKRIDDLVSKGRKNTIVKGVGNVDAAIKKFEKLVNAPLHLFWMYPSQWDKKTTPLVAFVPMDSDPDTHQSIPAFDSKGNSFTLDRNAKLAKNRPVIIVTLNERTTLEGKTKISRLASVSHEDIAKGTTSITIGEHTQASDKKGAQLTARATMIRVDWVDITDLAYDELPWDGGPEYEFYYWLTTVNTYYQNEPHRLWSYNSVGWTNQTSGSLRFNNSSANPMTNPVSSGYYSEYPEAMQFYYVEDDGDNLWDDHQGTHDFQAITPTGQAVDLQYGTGTVTQGRWGKIVQAQYTFY